MNKDRLEAFSDSVFGFAITLLILGIVLPELQNPPTESILRAALLHLWPNLLSYALSFAVIGIMWQNHQALFRLLGRADRMTVFLNLVLLGVIAFIPFATYVLGKYPTMHASTFLYGLTLTCAAIAFNLLAMHFERSGAFLPSVSKWVLRETIASYRFGLATYAIATLTSLYKPILSFALYLLVAAYFLFPRGADSDPAGDASSE